MEEKIPVVFGIDKKYILQVFVVMNSILYHSKENYVFYIITADDIEQEIKEFNLILNSKYSNYELRMIHISEKELGDVAIFCEHLSIATYNRLLAAEYIQEQDKCIYLDSDILVRGDLKELYETEIEDYYLAGVKDWHIIRDTQQERIHEKILGIPDRDTYINAGVLLMNLQKIREDNMVSRFLEQCKKENRNEDQDVLNVCCYGKIKILPLKYNLMHIYRGWRIRFLRGLPYSKEDFEFNSDDPFILHMGGVWKPWISERYIGADEWWKYAKLYDNTSEYEFYRNNCSKDRKQIKDIKVLLDWLTEKKVIIWGFSKNAKKACDILKRGGVKDICAFVDNDESNHGKQYQDVCVTSMQDVLDSNCDVVWIVSCAKAYKEVESQLLEAGVDKEDIVWWHEYLKKGWPYYQALTSGYYEIELETIALLEDMAVSQIKEYVIDQTGDIEMIEGLKTKYHMEKWLIGQEEKI